MKREEGVYAVKDAARVQRLSTKLQSLATGLDEDGDVLLATADSLEDGQEKVPGWSWFAVFGLLNHMELSVDSLDGISEDGLRRAAAMLEVDA